MSGVGLIKRKAAGTVTQHVVVTVDGNHINIKTTTTLSKQENDFIIGQKFRTPAFGLADGEYEVFHFSLSSRKITLVRENKSTLNIFTD